MTPVLTAKTAQSASPNQDRTDLQEIARFGDLVMLIAMYAAAAAALDIGNTRGQFGLALGASALLLAVGCVSYSVAFGRMQALGLTSCSTPQADFLTMLMQAMHVIVQSGLERFLAVRLRQSAIESPQLAAIVRSVNLSGLLVTLGRQQSASAGAGMASIVSGAQRVNQVIGDIATSAKQQTLGITQVGEVVTHLDTVTQQTAASVEESATAAKSLPSRQLT